MDPFAIEQAANAVVTEVRVERDENGKIIRVLDGKKARDNPLNDPLNDLDSDDEEDETELGELEVWLPSSAANWRITL